MALLNGSWFQFLSGSWGSSSSWAATTACRGVKQKTRHVTDMFERSGYFRHFRHIFNLFCYSFVILYFLIYFDNCRYWYWIIRKSEVQSCVVYCNIVMHCREKRRLPDLSGVRNEVRNGIFNPWISSVKQIHCVLSCVIPRPFIIFHHLSSSFIHQQWHRHHRHQQSDPVGFLLQFSIYSISIHFLCNLRTLCYLCYAMS